MATNYDPVKAHAYYMKNRQLKGRTSTAGMSKSDKEMAAYIKDQLKSQMQATKEKIKEERKQQRDQLSAALKSSIARVRDQIKALKGSGDEGAIERLRDSIKTIRAKATEARKKITETAKAKTAAANQTYKDTYAAEVGKLKAKYMGGGASASGTKPKKSAANSFKWKGIR